MATRSIAPDIPEIHIISIVDPIVDPLMSKEYFINAEGFTPWMKNKKLRQIITPDTATNQTEITIEKYAQEDIASKPHRLVLSFLNGQLPRI